MIRLLDLKVEGSAKDMWCLPCHSELCLVRIEDNTLVFLRSNDGLQIAASGFMHNGQIWIHASCSRQDALPEYSDLTRLKDWVFGTRGYAAQSFVPTAEHVNIHPYCLHLWGPLDPDDWPLPIFRGGTI